MRKKIMIVLLGTLMIIGTATYARRGHRGRGRGPQYETGHHNMFFKFLRNRELLKEIGVSETKLDQIKRIVIETQKKVIPIFAKIKIARINVHESLDADAINKSKVISLIKKMSELKSKIHIINTSAKIDILNMLTKKQREKIREFGKRRFKNFFRRKGRGPGERKGPHGPGRDED